MERDFRKGLLANLDARRCVLTFRKQYRFVVDPSLIYLTDFLVLVQVWSRSLSSSSSFSWSHESCISSLWSMSVRREDFFLFLRRVLYAVIYFV